MRLFLMILASLVVLAALWKLLSWALSLAMGLLWVALIVGAIVFVAGVLRRLMRI